MASLKMQRNIVMTDAPDEDESNLNNDDDSEINRGVELILRNRRRPETPKTFQLKFSFFNREITFCLDIKKK